MCTKIMSARWVCLWGADQRRSAPRGDPKCCRCQTAGWYDDLQRVFFASLKQPPHHPNKLTLTIPQQRLPCNACSSMRRAVTPSAFVAAAVTLLLATAAAAASTAEGELSSIMRMGPVFLVHKFSLASQNKKNTTQTNKTNKWARSTRRRRRRRAAAPAT